MPIGRSKEEVQFQSSRYREQKPVLMIRNELVPDETFIQRDNDTRPLEVQGLS